LPGREPVRDYQRLRAAVAARGEQFERALTFGLKTATAAAGVVGRQTNDDEI
jgi:hypothetical protein